MKSCFCPFHSHGAIISTSRNVSTWCSVLFGAGILKGFTVRHMPWAKCDRNMHLMNQTIQKLDWCIKINVNTKSVVLSLHNKVLWIVWKHYLIEDIKEQSNFSIFSLSYCLYQLGKCCPQLHRFQRKIRCLLFHFSFTQAQEATSKGNS